MLDDAIQLSFSCLFTLLKAETDANFFVLVDSASVVFA